MVSHKERDRMYGKRFALEVFENEYLIVQSSGTCIGVDIKNEHDEVISQWLLAYPFSGYQEIPSGCGCKITIMHRTENRIEIAFTWQETSFILACECTNPNAKPKTVEVEWT